jgi:hypothetical protein
LLIVKRHGGSVHKHLEPRIPTSEIGWFPRGNPVRSAAPFASDAASQSACAGQGSGCFYALVEKGLVKMQNFSKSKNKLRYAYLLMPAEAAEKSKLTVEFLRRKVVEYETLQAEIEILKAEMNPLKAGSQ